MTVNVEDPAACEMRQIAAMIRQLQHRANRAGASSLEIVLEKAASLAEMEARAYREVGRHPRQTTSQIRRDGPV